MARTLRAAPSALRIAILAVPLADIAIKTEPLTAIVTSAAVSTLLGGAAIWLGKSWIRERLSRLIEDEYNRAGHEVPSAGLVLPESEVARDSAAN